MNRQQGHCSGGAHHRNFRRKQESLPGAAQPSPRWNLQLPATQPWLSCRGRCCSLCNTTFCACSLAPYKSLQVSQQPFQPFKAACSYSSRKSLQLGFNKSVVLYILEKKNHILPNTSYVNKSSDYTFK